MKNQMDFDLWLYFKTFLLMFLPFFGISVFLKYVATIIYYYTNTWKIPGLTAVSSREMISYYLLAVLGLAFFIFSLRILLKKVKQITYEISRKGKEDC